VVHKAQNERRTSIWFPISFHRNAKRSTRRSFVAVLADANQNTKTDSTSVFEATARDKKVPLEYNFKVANAFNNFDNTYYLELDPMRYISNFKIQEDR
jgi:hypothetical protein